MLSKGPDFDLGTLDRVGPWTYLGDWCCPLDQLPLDSNWCSPGSPVLIPQWDVSHCGYSVTLYHQLGQTPAPAEGLSSVSMWQHSGAEPSVERLALVEQVFGLEISSPPSSSNNHFELTSVIVRSGDQGFKPVRSPNCFLLHND